MTTEEALEVYREATKKLYAMSKVQVRQLMGTQPEDDSRVNYLAGVQCYINLANAQIASLLRLVKALGIEPEEFMAVQLEEMDKLITALQEDLCIMGWSNGSPVFDLPAYKERTAGWPE